MKILAVVVTYYPEENLLKKNINAFIDYVDKVLIWENTPGSEKLSFRFIHDEKIEYCGDGINSISHGLNHAWHYAQDNGYDYLLTMDQDSVFENFQYLKKYGEEHFGEKIILGPCYNIDKIIIDENNSAIKTEVLITSGSLVCVSVLDKLGGYDEKLAIDGVDSDLCFRANRKGIYSYRVENCNLVQRFGEPEYKHFFGKKILLSSYSAKRLESILKAHIYLIRKHKDMSKEVKKYIIRHYIIERIRDIVLFENDKFNKILSMIKGIVKGLLVKI